MAAEAQSSYLERENQNGIRSPSSNKAPGGTQSKGCTDL